MATSGLSKCERIWLLLEQALQLSESERVDFVTTACGEESAMRERILYLLGSNEVDLLKTVAR